MSKSYQHYICICTYAHMYIYVCVSHILYTHANHQHPHMKLSCWSDLNAYVGPTWTLVSVRSELLCLSDLNSSRSDVNSSVNHLNSCVYDLKPFASLIWVLVDPIWALVACNDLFVIGIQLSLLDLKFMFAEFRWHLIRFNWVQLNIVDLNCFCSFPYYFSSYAVVPHPYWAFCIIYILNMYICIYTYILIAVKNARRSKCTKKS